MSETASLKNGTLVKYLPDVMGEGGAKFAHFTEDKQFVICFFKDQTDPSMEARLESVLGKFNPTLSSKDGAYWKKLFCWPVAIVKKPRLGILAPRYENQFYFAGGPWSGKLKKGRYFSSPRLSVHLPESERGAWINYFRICIQMARAVRKMHAYAAWLIPTFRTTMS